MGKLYHDSTDLIPIAHVGREWEGRIFMLFPSYARLMPEERERLATIKRYQDRVDREEAADRKRIAELSARLGKNLVPFLDDAKRHTSHVAAASYTPRPVSMPSALSSAQASRRAARAR